MPLTAVAAVLLLGLTAACGSVAGGGGHGGTQAGPAAASVTLTETGSTLLFPLMHKWATQYHEQFPNVTISTMATDSGTGIDNASRGTADIGASDAYLSSGDLATYPTLLNIPLAISAQQVNYNVPGFNGPGQINLDGQVLALMYEGKITNWNDSRIQQIQPNPHAHLPSRPVVPIYRSGSTGDTFLFSSYLSTQDMDWKSTFGYGKTVAWPPVPGEQAGKSNDDVVTKCAATVGCVAYVGISSLDKATRKGLGEAALKNAAGKFELPDATTTIPASVDSFVSSTPVNETISMVDGPAPDGYPIVNFEYAIVSMKQPDPAKAHAIRDFLTWVINSGNSPTYLTQVHFAPLPSDIATLGTAQIGRIG
jgi:phosphate transport system substrate-binding protein